jgi:glucose/arabinose dehydrogenase
MPQVWRPSATRLKRAIAPCFETLEPRRFMSASPLQTIWQEPVSAAVEVGVSRPTISTTEPSANKIGVRRDSFVAAYVLLPNVGQGVNEATLTSSNVKLYLASDSSKTPIPANLNTTGGGDAIILTPIGMLSANTAYTFEITEGLTDTSGAAFEAFSMSFTTGSAGGSTNSSIGFDKIALPTATGERFTGVTVGPDNRLYAATFDGEIYRWEINSDGTLASRAIITTVQTANGANRLITGLRFDPTSAGGNLILWVTHGFGSETNAPNWTGKLSLLTGSNLENYQDYVIGLPRSVRDHLTNQMDFDSQNRLFISQGSQNAMGAPDNAWGLREEVLLAGAVLRIDYNSIAARIAGGQGPLNVQTAEGGTYDPFAAGAAVTLYATGVRNAYDLLWHSNGYLYAPTNGSAPGGSTPAGNGAPALQNVAQVEPDWLFKIREGKYYGHPNPLRNEFVLNGGNPTAGNDKYQVNAYPEGTQPEANWDPAIFSFGNNRSPNGVIEYKSGTFDGELKGAMLVVRYSGGDDVLVLKPDVTGNIPSGGVKTGIDGLSGFIDPLDIAEQVGPGNLYVVEHGGQKITLLRPQGTGTPAGTLNSIDLYNANIDTSFGALENFPTISYAALGTTAITLSAEVSGAIGSVRWALDGNENFNTENFAPYSIVGEINNVDMKPLPISVGTHTVTATAYSGSAGTGTVLGTITHTFTVTDTPTGPVGEITGFTLYNALGDFPIKPLSNGSAVSFIESMTWGLTIKAETTGTFGSVRWAFDDNPNYRTENFGPYAIGGDASDTDLLPVAIAQGDHTVTVTAYSGKDATGIIIQTLSLNFTVIDQP